MVMRYITRKVKKPWTIINEIKKYSPKSIGQRYIQRTYPVGIH